MSEWCHILDATVVKCSYVVNQSVLDISFGVCVV